MLAWMVWGIYEKICPSSNEHTLFILFSFRGGACPDGLERLFIRKLKSQAQEPKNLRYKMTRRFLFSFPSVAEDNGATNGRNRIDRVQIEKNLQTAYPRSTINYRLLHEA